MHGGIVEPWTNKVAHADFWAMHLTFLEFEHGLNEDYKPVWSEVDFVFGPININEHWLMAAIDLQEFTIFVFDSMPDYIRADIVNSRLELLSGAIPSILIAGGFDMNLPNFKYQPWEVKQSKAMLQWGKSLDCGIFSCKFLEYLITNTNIDSLILNNMPVFRKQYVSELWANKFLW